MKIKSRKIHSVKFKDLWILLKQKIKVFSLKNQKKDNAGNDDAKNQQPKKLSAAQIRITKG